MEDRIESLIEIHVSEFLENRLKKIQKIDFEDYTLNPFLVYAVKDQLKMKNQKDLARWLVTQRSERGLVTSFGKVLQKIAKSFTDEPSTPGFTMTLVKNRKKYNIMVTSGPNPYSVRQAQDLRRQFEESIEIDSKSIPVLGMCYGNNDVVNSIIKKELKGMKYYAGRKFWQFLSGEEKCRDEILKIVRETANNFQDIDKKSIASITEKKVIEIEKKLSSKYGNNEKEFWTNLRDVYI